MRNENCRIRMNPDCRLVWPKFELPTVLAPCRARTLGRFSTFSTSSRSWPFQGPARPMSYCTTASTLYSGGVLTSVMVRGALPMVPVEASANAAGFTHVAVG